MRASLQTRQEEFALVQRAIAGDEDAFRSIWDTQHSRVMLLLYRLTDGDVERSEDLAQDVFLKIYQKLHTFRGEASLSTWIYRITVHLFLMQVRGMKGRVRTQSLDALMQPDGDHGGVGQQIQFQPKAKPQFFPDGDAERLFEMLPKSARVYRITIRMRFLEERSIQETAERLDCVTGAVKNYQHRALLAMRKKAMEARA
jgi:RNA polymerase sigma-70 factor, ECF subfamily